MNQTALHFHTKLSDWINTNEEMIELFKKLSIVFFIPTDHDIVNKKLVQLWKKANILCCDWVEVSSFDEKLKKNMHLLLYGKNISWEIDPILENTRIWKREKVQKQIELLNNNWFIIDYDEFIEYFKKFNFNPDNLNIGHIAEYIFLNEKNKTKLKWIVWNEVNKRFFMDNFLKWKTDYSKYWTVNLPNYAPTVENILEISKRKWYFSSLAHTHLTFDDNIDEICNFLESCWENLNWIEIPPSMNQNVVNKIIEFSEIYNLIVTFWNDYHWIIDSTHWELWDINPYVSRDFVDWNLRKLEKFLWIEY